MSLFTDDKESSNEDYLVKQAEARGAFVRKVEWVGRRSAPDRVLIIPEVVVPPWDGKLRAGAICTPTGFTRPSRTIWIELKRPGGKATFPCDERERAQEREHIRMRRAGADVRVIDCKEEIDELFA